MDALLAAGQITRGPRPFAPRDCSTFLCALDMAIVGLERASLELEN